MSKRRKVVEFLRAGNTPDYSGYGCKPLLGLLPRRLTDDDVEFIAGVLTRRMQRVFDMADIGAAITRVTDQLPLPTDMARIKRRIEEGAA